MSCLVLQVFALYFLAQGSFVVCGLKPAKSLVTNEHFVENYDEFPYIVALANSAQSYFGSGTIISQDKVLTAAQCILGKSAKTIQVHAGVLSPRGKGNFTQIRDVKESLVHPKFRRRGMRVFRYNMAILTLKKKFTFNQNVNRIKVYGDISSDDAITAISFGSTLTEIKMKEVRLSQVNSKKCQSYNTIARSMDSMICAKDEEEVQDRACYNYLGGPLVKHFPDDPRNDVLFGVVSWVANACATKRTFGFARDPEYWTSFRLLS